MAVVRVVWDLDVPEMNEWEPAEDPAVLRQIEPGEWYYHVGSMAVLQHAAKGRTNGVHLPVRRKWWLDCLRPEIVAVARDECGEWWGFTGLCQAMEYGATAGRWLCENGIGYPLIGIDPRLLPVEPDWLRTMRLRPGLSNGAADIPDIPDIPDIDVPGPVVVQEVTDVELVLEKLGHGQTWEEIAAGRLGLPVAALMRHFEASVGPEETRDLRAYFVGVEMAITKNWGKISKWSPDLAVACGRLSRRLRQCLYSHSEGLRAEMRAVGPPNSAP